MGIKKEQYDITANWICLHACVWFQNAEYTTGQVFDLADKLEQSEAQLGRTGFMLGMDPSEKKSEDKLAKSTKDG